MVTPVITHLLVPRPETTVPIRVLLADDSDVMRPVIARVLAEDSRIEVIGQATNFAETIQLASSLQPDVLLMDLHMRDEEKYPPEVLKSQVIDNTGCILAMSVWNDEKAKDLAKSFGAKVLMDKNNLYSELIPAILRYCLGGARKAPRD
jgi:two-component system, chemotaxis family, protein-glutamate methylesterase/glutaminase